MLLDDWLTRIESFHVKEIDLGLDRCRMVYEHLTVAGDLDNTPFIVTIGGTNGKGTTLKTLENALKAAGFSVGSYTSPHVFVFNERVRIDGIDASDEELVQAFEKVEACRKDVPLTYYEFTTLAAFVVFAQRKIKVMLLEVGLGGRLDTVNLLDADIAVLTSIALDHQAFLGHTRELIAAEKVAIARPGKLLFVGGSDLVSTISSFATTYNLKTYDYSSRSVEFNDSNWSFTFEGPSGQIRLLNLPLPLIPLANVALALQVWFYIAQVLGCDPVSVDLKHLVQTTHLFGRFSKLSGQYDIRVDAAHNPAAAVCLAEQLRQLPEMKNTGVKNIAICGIMADKDVRGTFAPVSDLFDEWVLWPLSGNRALSQESLRRVILELGIPQDSIHLINESSLQQSLKQLLEENADARFVVFGSFFMIEAFMDTFLRI